MDNCHSLGCKLELSVIISELLILIIVPCNKVFMYSTAGKVLMSMNMNYVELGFDPNDKCCLILCCCFKGRNDLFLNSRLWSEITVQSNGVTDGNMLTSLCILLAEQAVCRCYYYS